VDSEYYEGLLNYEGFASVDNAQLFNCYSFSAGDIVVDVDKNLNEYSESSFVESSQSLFEENTAIDNSEIVNEIVENNEVIQSEIVQSEIVNEIENNEVIQSEIIQNEIVQNEIVNEIENNEVIQSEIVQNEIVQNEIVNQIFENNEVIQSEIVHVENSVVDAAVVNNYSSAGAPPVTVNFNAFNEFNSSGADVDSVMTAFSERLAEAVSMAAEGLHL